MKLSQRVLKLERHRYAPELNTLHFKGGSRIRTPGATSIREALGRLGRGRNTSTGSACFMVVYDFLLDGEIALQNQRRYFQSRSDFLLFKKSNEGVVQVIEGAGYVPKHARMDVKIFRSSSV